LIVDDDMAVQTTVRLLLERAGHSVVTAGDGRKGLTMFESGDFDLLFLDIFMPGMDGFETMRLIHQLRPLVPIIVISGRPISSEPDGAPNFLTMAIKLGAVSSLQSHSSRQPCSRPSTVVWKPPNAGQRRPNPPMELLPAGDANQSIFEQNASK